MTSIERTILEILAFLSLLGGFALWEQHKGAAACKAADVSAVHSQEAQNAKTLATDVTTNGQIEDTLHAAEIAPITAPVVRVCLYTPASPVSSAAAATRGLDEPSGLRSPDPGTPIPGPDIGKPAIQIGHNANAEIAGLIAYIKQECLVK